MFGHMADVGASAFAISANRAAEKQQEASRRACVSQHLMAQPGVVSVRWKPNASRPVVVRMGKTNIPEVKHGNR